LKTKKYAVPIGILHPYFLVGIAATYLTNGRFDMSKNASVVAVKDQEQALLTGNADVLLKASDLPSAPSITSSEASGQAQWKSALNP
jgi:hypothetical protein